MRTDAKDLKVTPNATVAYEGKRSSSRAIGRTMSEAMSMKRNTVLSLFVFTLLSMTGCDRHSSEEVYYLIATNMSMPYWQTVSAGFKKAAAEYKVTAKVVGPDNYDPQAELAELHNAIAAKPAGILIQVANAPVLQPEIDSAVDAGIPVITIDSDAVGSRRLYFIGTNNLEAGRLGGKRVVQKLGSKANVVFFTLSGQPSTDERLKGFKDTFSDWPEIKIVEVVDLKRDVRIAFDKTQEFMALTGPHKIDAFVFLESDSGKMVADAVQRAGGSDRLVVAWDVNKDTLDGIKAGTIDSTVAQKPFTMAYVGLKGLDEVYHSQPNKLNRDYSAHPFAPYPVFVDTGTSLVDRSNVDRYLSSAAAEAK